MVYGNADLTGVPWETIIKCFRRELGDQRLPHLRDYADRLIDYITGHKLMFSEQSQERQFLTSVFTEFVDILREIDRNIEEAIPQGGSVEESSIRAIVISTIRNRHKTWVKAERLPGVPTNYEETIQEKWFDQISDLIGAIFEKLPVGKALRSRLVDIASMIFAKDLFPEDLSGVVVAGFGEDDYLPGLFSFDVEGVLLNVVKVRKNEDKSTTIATDNSAVIVPFAQGEMVYLFMEGIDPRFRYHLQRALEDFVDGLADDLVTSTKVTGSHETALRDQIRQACEGPAEKFFTQLASYGSHRHVQPVISAVANLPKEEIATMAESLVSLTSFKRRVTHDPETVGGPVDVAVISKGDGFIWINRKHYFNPALNHQFFANYYRT